MRNLLLCFILIVLATAAFAQYKPAEYSPTYGDELANHAPTGVDADAVDRDWRPCSSCLQAPEVVPPAGHVFYTCCEVLIAWDWFASTDKQKQYGYPDMRQPDEEPNPTSATSLATTGCPSGMCFLTLYLYNAKDQLVATISDQPVLENGNSNFMNLGLMPAGWYSLRASDDNNEEVIFDFSVTSFNHEATTLKAAEVKRSPYGTLLFKEISGLPYMRLYKQMGINWFRVGTEFSDEPADTYWKENENYDPSNPMSAPRYIRIRPVNHWNYPYNANEDLNIYPNLTSSYQYNLNADRYNWIEVEKCDNCVNERAKTLAYRCALNRSLQLNFNMYMSLGGRYPYTWHKNWNKNQGHGYDNWSWSNYQYLDPGDGTGSHLYQLSIDAQAGIDYDDFSQEFNPAWTSEELVTKSGNFPPDDDSWSLFQARLERHLTWMHRIYGVEHLEFAEEPGNSLFQTGWKVADLLDKHRLHIQPVPSGIPFDCNPVLAMQAPEPTGAMKTLLEGAERKNLLYWPSYPSITATRKIFEYSSNVIKKMQQTIPEMKLIGTGDITGYQTKFNENFDYSLNGHTFCTNQGGFELSPLFLNAGSAPVSNPTTLPAIYLKPLGEEMSPPFSSRSQIDYLSFHPYWGDGLPEYNNNWGSSANLGDLRTQATTIREFYNKYASNNGLPPNNNKLWSTEFGFPSTRNHDLENSFAEAQDRGESYQAAMVPRMHLNLFNVGYERAIWFTLADWRKGLTPYCDDGASSAGSGEPVNQYYFNDKVYHDKDRAQRIGMSYGFFRAHGTAKPSFLAYKAMTTMLPAGNILSYTKPSGKQDYHCVLYQPTPGTEFDRVIAIWRTTLGVKTVRVTLPNAWNKVVIVHNDGSKERAVGIKGGIDITLNDDEIVYLKMAEFPNHYSIPNDHAEAFLNRFDGVFLEGVAYLPEKADAPCYVVFRKQATGLAIGSYVKTCFVSQESNYYLSRNIVYNGDPDYRVEGAHTFKFLVPNDLTSSNPGANFWVEVYSKAADASAALSLSAPNMSAVMSGGRIFTPNAGVSNINDLGGNLYNLTVPAPPVDSYRPIGQLEEMDENGAIKGYVFDPDDMNKGSEIGICIGQPWQDNSSNNHCLSPTIFASIVRNDLSDKYGLKGDQLAHGFLIDPRTTPSNGTPLIDLWRTAIANDGSLNSGFLVKNGTRVKIYGYGIDRSNPGRNNSNLDVLEVKSFASVGNLDKIDHCSSVLTGWAMDPNAPDKPITVKATFTRQAAPNQTLSVTALANMPRVLDGTTEQNNSGFMIPVPTQCLDQAVWDVFVTTEDGQIPASTTATSTTIIKPSRFNSDDYFGTLYDDLHFKYDPNCAPPQPSAFQTIIGRFEGVNKNLQLSGWVANYRNTNGGQSKVLICNNLPGEGPPSNSLGADNWYGKYCVEVDVNIPRPDVIPNTPNSSWLSLPNDYIGFDLELSKFTRNLQKSGFGELTMNCETTLPDGSVEHLENAPTNHFSVWAWDPGFSLLANPVYVPIFPKIDYTNHRPIGRLEGVMGNMIYGWALDPDEPQKRIDWQVCWNLPVDANGGVTWDPSKCSSSGTKTFKIDDAVRAYQPLASLPGFEYDLTGHLTVDAAMPLTENRIYAYAVDTYNYTCNSLLMPYPLTVRVDASGNIASVIEARYGRDSSTMNNIRVFPSPAKSVLYIESTVNLPQETHVNLITSQGALIQAPVVSSKGNVQVLDVANLAAGIYLLLVKGPNGNVLRHRVSIIR